jgi:hypothetical protein
MNEHYIHIWEKSNLMAQARQIIEGISKFPQDSNLSIIIRHSHRIETEDMQKMSTLGLTGLGKGLAEIFGTKLPLKYSIRLYHSIVSRCEETAVSILKGFQNVGGSGEILGSYEPLYNFGKDSDFVMENAYKYPGAKFINRWAAGLFPDKYIKKFTDYCIQTALEIWNQPTQRNVINIYITHDLAIMALKYGWFGIAPDKHWVNFLGGIVMTILNDSILIFDDYELKTLEIPYWLTKPKNF